MAALKTVEERILEHYAIKDYYDQELMIWQYCIVDKITEEEKAQIQLSFVQEATVAEYASNNHHTKWFMPSETITVDAINVRSLTSHQKGLGSLMLAYGVLQMKRKDPKIKYSILDDMSDHSTRIKNNIYSRFGYSPVEAVTRTGENTVQIQGAEKQVLLTDFVKHVQTMFPRAESRGRNSSRKAESRRSSSRRKANRS
jgi:hypothetical protein